MEIESTNIKARLRRGKAYSATDEWDLAERDFNEILLQQPDNVEAKQEIVALKRKMARQNQKDKKTFAGMFQKMEKLEEEDAKRLEKEKEILAEIAKKEVTVLNEITCKLPAERGRRKEEG